MFMKKMLFFDIEYVFSILFVIFVANYGNIFIF